jgi:N-methylhydantoinase A
MHACALARELRVPRVIVPNFPAHFSAWGMLMSDLRHDLVQTRFARVQNTDPAELTAVWRDLEERMLGIFGDEGVGAEDVAFARSADMRYAGQEHTVNVPIPAGELAEPQRAEVQDRFHDLHEQLYTFRQESPAEIVNFRLTGFGAVAKPELRRIASNGSARAARKGVRDVDYDELGRLESTIYERGRLGAGAEIDGPAVVEEPAASTVVFPGQTLRVDEYGNLVVDTEAA